MVVFGSYQNFKSVFQPGNSNTFGGGLPGPILYTQDANGVLVKAGIGFHAHWSGGDTIWIFTDQVDASNMANDFSEVVQVSDIRYDVNVVS